MYWNTCFLLSIQIGQLISCLGDLKESLALKDSFLKINDKDDIILLPSTAVISILITKQTNPLKEDNSLKNFSFYNQYTEYNFRSVQWSYNKLQQWQNQPFSKHSGYYEPNRTYEKKTINILLTLHPERREEEARLGKTLRFQWHHFLNHPS